nr:reverse transcriptase domain-containing protein [Tanacetum cinerariifolium]
MRTRSSSNLPGESSHNPTSLNPKRYNRRRSNQPFILEESPIYTMADQRTMAELLRAPTKGYAEEIVVPLILAEHFELKHSLINMMTSDQFFGLEKDNPHDHIRWFNKITSTIKCKDVPNSAIKLFLFPLSLAGAARRMGMIQNLLRACPHHGFTKLHQLAAFYNALNPVDQDSLNSTVGGNLLERHTQDVLMIIENKSQNMMASFFQMNTASTSGLGPLPSNTIANPKGELKSITTRSGLVLDGPSIPMPPPSVNLEEDERVEETLTDPKLDEFTIKVPPPLIQKAKPPSQRNFQVHQRDFLHPNIPYPSRMHKQKQKDKDEIQIHKIWQMFKQLHINITLADALILILKYQKMLKALLSNKEKLLELANTPLNENCSAVNLKKLPEKLGDPRKFLISCGFSELKCKALADLGASINLMPLIVWKKLGLPELISTCINLELANWVICTPAGIARDVFVPVGKFTFPTDFVIVDYESDLRVPLILGRPFLQTALIDIHGEEMILRDDYLKDLFATNHLSGNPTFSSHSDLTSPEVKEDIFDPKGDIVLIEKLLNLDSTKDLPPPHNINPLSGSSTSSSPDHLLEEFEEKVNESKLLIDELDLPTSSAFLPSLEYDSFLFDDFFEVAPNKNVKKISKSHASLILKDFDPPLYELPFHKEVPRPETLLSFSTENEEKVFKPEILTYKGVHTSPFTKISYRGSKVFKVNKTFESPMETCPCSYGEDICILDVPCLLFYPP